MDNTSGLNMLGSSLTPNAVASFVERVVQTNIVRAGQGGMPVPVCIWGTHGIGKTALVEEIARSNGWEFAYVAPAQFEEMGDLHGLPVSDGLVTRFAPPEWVPTASGPGILLLDDFNRADDRILRGLMQLLQRFELQSWSLPDRWQIVVTANPEGGDYSVTPLDDAMLTRMLHVSMTFEPRQWARWALDHGVDARGVSFVLTYPEVVAGSRTTPRSLTQFFEQIVAIRDLEADWDLVAALAASALDAETATAFMAFVADGLTELLGPEEILDAPSANELASRVAVLAGDEHGVRLDRLSAVCTRLYLHLTSGTYEPADAHQANLVGFLSHPAIPNDLRVSLHQDLVRDGSQAVVAMMRDKALAELALAGM